ncbi:hypothetical protein LXL04_035997 [Taraxacum kok-saghyz]
MTNLPMDYNLSCMPINHPFVAFAVKDFDFFQLLGQLMPVQTAKNGSFLSIIPIMPSDAVFPGNPQQQPAKNHTRISCEIQRLPSVSLSSRKNSSSFPRPPKDEFPKLPLAVYADLDPHLTHNSKLKYDHVNSDILQPFSDNQQLHLPQTAPDSSRFPRMPLGIVFSNISGPFAGFSKMLHLIQPIATLFNNCVFIPAQEKCVPPCAKTQLDKTAQETVQFWSQICREAADFIQRP